MREPDSNRQPSGYEPDELPTAPSRDKMVEGEGFEPSKAVPADLQSAPFGQLGNPSTMVTRITSYIFNRVLSSSNLTSAIKMNLVYAVLRRSSNQIGSLVKYNELIVTQAFFLVNKGFSDSFFLKSKINKLRE